MALCNIGGGVWALALTSALAAAGAAGAQDAEAPAVGEIVVIGTTPLDTAGVPLDKLAAAAAVLDADDVSRSGPASVLRSLDERLGGVALDQAQANPFQPNLLYRGFEASPLAGDPQGLAVYVNGARFNQPFGDTVNWDLLPDVAVRRIELVGSNPAFGLNALGGALSVRLKDGFADPGGELELSGGAFGRRQGSLEYAAASGAFGIYAALSGVRDDGWRDFSPSRVRQAYADLGWRGETGELHLGLLGADNDLTGNGPAPVELLATRRASVFTQPDETHNRYGRITLGGTRRLDSGWSLQAGVYAAQLRQGTVNGDAAEVEPCVGATLVCLEDAGDPLIDILGRPVPNFVTSSPYAAAFPRFRAGGPYALLNRTRTLTQSYGTSVQLSGEPPVMGRANRLAIGASLDWARTSFSADTTIGGLSLARAWFGPGVALDDEDAGIRPVAVRATNRYLGVFLSDTLDLTPALSLTVSARYNDARVRLHDRIGDDLDGDHRFRRFNPAAGLAWRLGGGLSVYGGYAEANRAPTPAELSCADPEAPCSLTNFFLADPPLKQVVARTWEAGLRGGQDLAAGRLTWRAGLYRTDAHDDIQLVASDLTGRGYFTNVGATRREGLEAGADFERPGLRAYVDYAYTRATYRTGFVLSAGDNPAFDDPSDPMPVRRGDRRPGVPAHNLKVGLDWEPTPAWKFGVDAQAASGRYFAGDEANLNRKTGPYALANLHAEYRPTPRITLFGLVQNLTDAKYATFGTFADLEAVPVLEAPDLEDPRSVSPGAPRAVYLGLRLSF